MYRIGFAKPLRFSTKTKPTFKFKFQYIGKSSRDAGVKQKRKEKWDLVEAKFNRGRREKWPLQKLKNLRTREIKKKKASVATHFALSCCQSLRLV